MSAPIGLLIASHLIILYILINYRHHAMITLEGKIGIRSGPTGGRAGPALQGRRTHSRASWN